MESKPLPTALYRASQVREMDRLAMTDMGIPGICLMERAGTAAFNLLCQRWRKLRRIIVLCGVGNNAGDGYVLARLAYLAGYDVTVIQIGDSTQLKGDARTAFEALNAVGLQVQVFAEKKLSIMDVVVDALFGTGLDREVSGEYRKVIEAVERSPCPVMSLDIPSGLHADTGTVMGIAIRADVTISFIGLKQGLFTGDGPEYCGEIYFDDLQIPNFVPKQIKHTVTRIDAQLLRSNLPRRARTAHKGNFGHVLIIGGEHGMLGAARLAAEAAARVGAGKVSIATRASHANLINLTRPELMSHGVETAEELLALIEIVDVVAIGTGLGQSAWGITMLETIKDLKKPVVLDADALNLLAKKPFRFEQSIMTPHPMEAARLLNMSIIGVQRDRFTTAQSLQLRFGGVCVLKGSGTLVAEPNGKIGVCTTGNPGMASGGMGDVLTGVIASLLAQKHSLVEAARLGVCLHGKAGDRAALEGERGLLASDLMPWLRYYANPDLLE
jgi:NAD(P)H-hydrate epimerase